MILHPQQTTKTSVCSRKLLLSENAWGTRLPEEYPTHTSKSETKKLYKNRIWSSPFVDLKLGINHYSKSVRKAETVKYSAAHDCQSTDFFSANRNIPPLENETIHTLTPWPLRIKLFPSYQSTSNLRNWVKKAVMLFAHCAKRQTSAAMDTNVRHKATPICKFMSSFCSLWFCSKIIFQA